MDCTYFGRNSCYLIVRDWYIKKNIYVQYLARGYETIADYVQAVHTLEYSGNVIDGIVVDGRAGVLTTLSSCGYSVQMCQFHQKQIIRRYLTKHPQTQAGQELALLVQDLTRVTQDILCERLTNWYSKHRVFLSEKTYTTVIQGRTTKWNYTHRRVRSAYGSLKRNLPYLFTYQTHNNMPNTTNSADGYFSHLKDNVRVHRGLTKMRKHHLTMYLIVRS